MSNVAKLKEVLAKIKVDNKCDAEKVVRELCSFVNDVEDKIAEIAIEYQIRAHIAGPYGASRWVSLEGDSYYDIEPGEWQASAQSC
jgi:hypothetical protein